MTKSKKYDIVGNMSMNNIKTATHKNITITFNEEQHSYIDDRNRRYTSATTLVKSFFPPFQAEVVAKLCAGKGKYKDMEVSEILQAWEEKREVAATRGTKIHKEIEDYLSGKKVELSVHIQKFLSKFMHIYELVELEKIIFSPKYLVSGTIDALFRHKETKEYLIVDWKTNEEIKTQNYRSKGEDFLKHLPDCNYSHYSLQLNLYQFILEEEGYFPTLDYKKLLVHIKDDIVEEYEIEDRQKEIEIMVNI